MESPIYSTETGQEESIATRIYRVSQDISDLENFYHVGISPAREHHLRDYYEEELASLNALDIEYYDQDSKVDFILLKNYLERQLRTLDLDLALDAQSSPLFAPFAPILVRLLEDRIEVVPIDAKRIAEDLVQAQSGVAKVKKQVGNGATLDMSVSSAYRAAKVVDNLRKDLSEWFKFYVGYDPLFTWWVSAPYSEIDSSLGELASVIRKNLVHIAPDGKSDTIVGQPIGRQGLIDELEAEMFDYSPEEILAIADQEFAWCEVELLKASRELGYGDNWHAAMEYVKTLCVEPGQQRYLVHELAKEAIDFVRKYDLVTIPPIAAKIWPTYMMSPEEQKVNPFFLGGSAIIVSFPTSSMSHEDKLMSIKGNNIHFSRATVFHELLPGHHLQTYMMTRFRPYRQLFDTPFWIEGWALYWEFKLWDDARFSKTPENRMGMLFWRLHRCARILFSVNFHLGRMTPTECIDFLIKKVGHEPANAEGEVRRSLSGEYPPLYQAAYMLGALQIRALYHEMVEKRKLYGEKEFHDTVMKSNTMPIGMLRALMSGQDIAKDFRPDWRFYGEFGLTEDWTSISLKSS